MSPASDQSHPLPEPGHANRLAGESSAYLLQHSHNPVDWHPWGREALEKARAEDRPLLVSIGYSACHWCHVMERESFESPQTAALMNRDFVCIKVDREERPDVDQIYMDAVVKLTGRGGWPLTAFCTPDGRPFYLGTYYPPEPRHGMPSFSQVLTAIADAFANRRDEVEESASRILEALRVRPGQAADDDRAPDLVADLLGEDAAKDPDVGVVSQAAQLIMRSADTAHGGFGNGSKFPTPTNLEILLTALDFLPEDAARATMLHLAFTAKEMARRGLFDQLGGGFHRYCVDASFTIPHFEKMLYDQGLLLGFYAELSRRAKGNDDLEWPIRETFGYLVREMRGPGGAFFASQDADSEGVEGRYFVWTPDEVRAVLGEGADEFCTAYGVTSEGNFEHGTTQLVDLARQPREKHAAARAKLFDARSRRTKPSTDEKRVAAWNGYVISGLARAAAVLEDDEMLAAAVAAADFVLAEMVDDAGHLQRVHDGRVAKIPAFLDDHAAMLVACLDLHRAGGGDRFAAAALRLGRDILERFQDREAGTLFFTPEDGEPLVHRPRSDSDGATPDAAGLAALGLERLASVSGEATFADAASDVLRDHAALLDSAPHAFPTLLRALALRARGAAVAVVVGDPDADATRALARRARRVLLPDDAVVVAAPAAPAPEGVDPAWLRGRERPDRPPVVHLCRGRTCSLPIRDPAALVADVPLLVQG